jgi:ATP-dependent DNA helicase RecQ
VLQVTNEDEKLQRALTLVARSDGAGLVYTATVKAAEAVHAALRNAGSTPSLYTASSRGERKARQGRLHGRTARVMVATNAFGLGHRQGRHSLRRPLPDARRARRYYQESGRAGRDGEIADCTLLFLHSDKAVQQFFLAGRYPSKEDVADLYGALQREGAGGRAWTLEMLQEALDRPKAKLQVALRLLRHQGVVVQGRDGRLSLTRAGLDADALARLMQAYRDKRESDRAMLERMVFYGQTGRCRWKVLLDNFDRGEALTVVLAPATNCVRIAAAFAADEPRGGSARGRRRSGRRGRAPEGQPQPSAGRYAQADGVPAASRVIERGVIVNVRAYGRGIVDDGRSPRA